MSEKNNEIELGETGDGTRGPVRLGCDEFLERIARRREGLDFLRYDDGGRTVTNCGKEALSPGCRSCKEGRWICVFPSYRCNADCAFCPQSRQEKTSDRASAGRFRLDEFLLQLAAKADLLTGVSISGGELFLNWDAAVRIIKHVSENHPHIYTWAYTNGIAATPDKLRELRDLGLQEIRFNVAAGGFHPKVLRQAAHAVRMIPWVSVEVPSCEQTYHHLVAEELLPRLAEVGVKQLNLAEVFIPENPSNATTTYDPGKNVLYRFTSRGGDIISPVESRLRTYDIFEYAEKKGIGIRIHDCSNEAKELQIEARAATSGLLDLAAVAKPETTRRMLERKLRELPSLLDRLEAALSPEQPPASLGKLGEPSVLKLLFEIEARRLVRMGPDLAPLLRRLLSAGQEAAAAGLLPWAAVAALRDLLARLAEKLRRVEAWDPKAPLWWEPLPPPRPAEGREESLNAHPDEDLPDELFPTIADPSLAEMLLPIDSPCLPAGVMLLHELRDDELTGRFHVRRPAAGDLRVGLVTTTHGAGKRLDLWCRHHFDLGVAHIVVVFDRPEEEDEAAAAARLRDAYPPARMTLWSSAQLARERWPQVDGLPDAGVLVELARSGRRSSQTVAARQVLNASAALAAAATDELGGAPLDWLVHLDDDELWVAGGPARGGSSLAQHFAAAAEMGWKLVHYVNHELLLPSDPAAPRFKVNPQLARARLGPRGWNVFCEQLAMRPADLRPYFHGYVNGKAAVAVDAGVAAAGVHGWHLAEHFAGASVTVAGPLVLHLRYPTPESFCERYVVKAGERADGDDALFAPSSTEARAVALVRTARTAGKGEETLRDELGQLYREVTHFTPAEIDLLSNAGLIVAGRPKYRGHGSQP
ncbi:MAG: radical SAM protein [bacterium]|nr:radical SAM protein [bacterium]